MTTIFAAAATFASIFLAGYWLVASNRGAEARVLALQPAEARPIAETTDGRRGRPFLVGRLLPSRTLARTATRLNMAGNPLDASAMYTLVLFFAIGLPALFVGLVWLIFGSAPSGVGLLLILFVGFVFGAVAPFRWLRWLVNKRQATMRKRLPDMLDLLTLCVEAGLGLDAAFRRVSDEMEGPLSEEISTMLDEVDLGKPRRQALVDMAKRCGVPEIDLTVNAVIQSQQIGSSLARTLRAQAHQLRTRRRQRAEQLARQAGVKMAFPLVLCLMPSLFVVVLGPIGVQIVHTLSK
jgi:tight adherence protein C